MPQLTVLTMNCLGLPVTLPGMRRRLRALGSALADSEADLTCLQEVGRWRYLPLLRRDETAWPHAITVLHPYMPRGGLATFSRLPIVDTSYHQFRERGRAASLHATERYQSKGVLRTTLVIEGSSVVVLNTHLSANYTADWSYRNPYARVERAQLRELAEVVEAIPAKTLLVVAGDFNVPRGSWLYAELRAATGLIDPLADSPDPTYRPMRGMPSRAAQALDHILVRAPEHLSITIESELCFRDPVWLAHGTRGYLSDHLGIRLRLRWSDQDSSASATSD